MPILLLHPGLRRAAPRGGLARPRRGLHRPAAAEGGVERIAGNLIEPHDQHGGRTCALRPGVAHKESAAAGTTATATAATAATAATSAARGAVGANDSLHRRSRCGAELVGHRVATKKRGTPAAGS